MGKRHGQHNWLELVEVDGGGGKGRVVEETAVRVVASYHGCGVVRPGPIVRGLCPAVMSASVRGVEVVGGGGGSEAMCLLLAGRGLLG